MGTNIEKAIEILGQGDVVGIPTETVYGLAASIESNKGIKRIFEIKERPFFDPLIVHISIIEQAKKYSKNWNHVCTILADNFWPGPLTIVLEKSSKVDDLITAGLNSVGIRMPKHNMTLELINKLGHPVAAPSANKFKKTSPTNYSHVTESFPDTYVLDGGPCTVGIESTVIGVFENKVSIYRPGMISKSNIEDVLEQDGLNITVEQVESPVAPGQLKHHYMPRVPVILLKGDAENKLSSIGAELMKNPAKMILGSSAVIAARDLYQDLRTYDQGHSCIIIKLSLEQLEDDMWLGILNRLEKAATHTLSE